jgi:plastocyanin
MRRCLLFLLLPLAVWAGACSDDSPTPPPPASYSIETPEPAISINQDQQYQLQITVKRGDDLVKYPKTATVDIIDGGYSPETLHVDAGARVTWRNATGVSHGVDFRNAPAALVDIPRWTAGDSVRTLPEPNTARDTTYIYRCNNPTHTADSGFIRVHASPLLIYRSADYSIANVNRFGVVTGIRGGSTTIHVSGSGAQLDIPVTVTAREATGIELTFLDPLRMADRLTEDTIFAYPARSASSQLRAVVMAGSDTVFCNRCANFSTRPQRYVTFVSRDTTKLLVRGSANPASPDTSGRLFARDTTQGSNGVWVVLETADALKDSVLVHIKLRPIDSLEVRLDSFPNPDDPNDRDPYPSTVIKVDSSIALGVTFRSMAQDPPDPNTGILPPPSWITVAETGTGRRSTLPLVTYETAHETYLEITSTGVITGRRYFTDAANRVLTCTSTAGVIPGTLFTGPTQPDSITATGTRVFKLPINPEAVYTIPGCTGTGTAGPTNPLNPRKITPMPGALCTGYQAGTVVADPTSICQVLIRGTATDPVTGRVLSDVIPIVIRRP